MNKNVDDKVYTRLNRRKFLSTAAIPVVAAMVPGTVAAQQEV